MKYGEVAVQEARRIIWSSRERNSKRSKPSEGRTLLRNECETVEACRVTYPWSIEEMDLRSGN